MSAAVIASLITPPPRRSSLYPVQRTPSLTNSESTTPDSSEEIAAFPPVPNTLPSTSLPSISEKGKEPVYSIPSIPVTPPLSPRRPRQRRRRDSVYGVFTDARILSILLPYLTWEDVRALCYASHHFWHVMSKPRPKDVLLAHFVPGYRVALRSRDRRHYEDVIRMDLQDFELLMLSLETPLHHYPMHALSVLSSEAITSEQDAVTKRLQLLSQAHSRVVLLLQSMVHSSSLPLTSELEDARSKFTNSPQSALRELTFPAPLAYFGPDAAKKKKVPNAVASSTVTSSTKRSRSAQRSDSPRPKSILHSRRHMSDHDASSLMDTTNTTDAERKSRRLSQSTRSRRMSIFGREPLKPPPLPSSEPTSLRMYSGLWRRNWGFASDDEDIFRPPKRLFAASTYSSDSSLASGSSSPAPTGSLSLPALARTVSTNMPVDSSSSSPHDLFIATSRRRAPVLRVFVPCSALSEDAIAACEDQLVEHGLWEHLSVGDVVCNFGYVPPVEQHDRDENRFVSGNGGSVVQHGTSSLSSSVHSTPPSQIGHGPQDERLWLVYNGEKLVVYRPSDAAPVPDALTLPSPFYYAHILPSGANPRFRIALPSMRATYSLARLSGTISSPHSFNGIVRVKTYQWLATASCTPNSSLGSSPTGLGIGVPPLPLPFFPPQRQQYQSQSQIPSNPQSLAMSVTFTGKTENGVLNGTGGGGSDLNGGSAVQIESFKTATSTGVGLGTLDVIGLGSGVGYGARPVPLPASYSSAGVTNGRGGEAFLSGASMSASSGMNVSVGWHGEWVLQGEGTREGKKKLQELLKGGGTAVGQESSRSSSTPPMDVYKREWEVVRERCGGGRLWLRLLPTMNTGSQPQLSNASSLQPAHEPFSPPHSHSSHNSSLLSSLSPPTPPTMKEFGVVGGVGVGVNALSTSLPSRIGSFRPLPTPPQSQGVVHTHTQHIHGQGYGLKQPHMNSYTTWTGHGR